MQKLKFGLIIVAIGLGLTNADLCSAAESAPEPFSVEAFKELKLKTSLGGRLQNLRSTENFSTVCLRLITAMKEAATATKDGKVETLRTQLEKKIQNALVELSLPPVSLPQSVAEKWLPEVKSILDEVGEQYGEDFSEWDNALATAQEAFETASKWSPQSSVPSKKTPTKVEVPAEKPELDRIKSDVPDTFGLVDYVDETATKYGIPKFDQEPEESAFEFQQMYNELEQLAKKLARQNDGQVAEGFQDELLDAHKKKREELLAVKPGRRRDWTNFFSDLESKLQEAINEDKFDYYDIRHWQLAIRELSEGFRNLSDKLQKEPGAVIGGVSPGTAGSGSGSVGYYGASPAAAHHARAMSRIYRRHERRSYGIQRTYARW